MTVRNVLITVLTIVVLTFFNSHLYASQKTIEQELPPIIDMHVHAFQGGFGQKDYYGNSSSANAEMLFKETYERFRKHNIVKAVVSGPLECVEKWKSKDEENRIIRGILMLKSDDDEMNAAKFERLVRNGKIEVYGEIVPPLSGTTISDPEWQPYLKICEQYDIPLAIHTGCAPPAVKGTFTSKSRRLLDDPFLIEDVIVNYPKLRIYLCHSGGGYHERVLVLMSYYLKTQ